MPEESPLRRRQFGTTGSDVPPAPPDGPHESDAHPRRGARLTGCEKGA